MELVAGVDEAGRGPLVGNVVAAAVILSSDQDTSEITDSKKLSEKKRELLFEDIISNCLAYNIVSISPTTIDEINILNATMLAMKEAVNGLEISPNLALIDGNKVPDGLCCNANAVVKGDSLHANIGAASILAKVTRDRQMAKLDLEFPQYGFAKHKGYPTKAHLEAIQEHGILADHRKSYGPIKKAMGSLATHS